MNKKKKKCTQKKYYEDVILSSPKYSNKLFGDVRNVLTILLAPSQREFKKAIRKFRCDK